MLLVTVAAIGAATASGAVRAASCDDLLPTVVTASGTRGLTATDLVRLRDIGGMGVGDIQSKFLAISPDGRQLAFQIRRAEPVSNRYCFGMAILDLGEKGPPRLIDQGGDYIQATFEVAGFARNTPPGYPLTIEPKWSANGKWVAYLRRDHGVTQVWRAAADGHSAVPITNGTFDVESFNWLPGGDAIVFFGRPGLVVAEQNIDEEGKSGFLYGDRFSPVSKLRPFVKSPIAAEFFVQAIDGQAKPASPSERAILHPLSPSGVSEGALSVVSGPFGSVAWQTSSPPASIWLKTDLHARTPAGPDVVCRATVCDNVADMWWEDSGLQLVLLVREGWHRSELGVYTWTPGEGAPRRVLATPDALLGCALVKVQLICGQESSLKPRRIVAIDLRTGRRADIFDPNPEFAQIRLGAVRRLTWTNDYGEPSYGDLVLPPDYRTGEKIPMVVVNYDSRGFLRGGTGDEYPIQLFAARHLAVLSVTNPDHVGLKAGANTGEALDRLGHQDWIDRKNVQSSIEAGVRAAEATGAIDKARLGITGLSDGGSTVLYALINSHMFAAAATSSCCTDISSADYLVGPSVRDGLVRTGYPTLMRPSPDFWKPMSLHQSASQVTAPLLMQLADREFITALESYTALEELKRPIELYVFPDENHVKWQPAHRLAVYERSADWFSFWLAGNESPDPEKRVQYVRWRALREQMPPSQ